MTQLITIDLDIERESVAKLYVLWVTEQDKLDKLKAECSAARHAPPNDYWQAEHKAMVKYNAALNFLTVLESYVI